MTYEQIITQLESLIEDAESHRNSDGTLDDVFQNDVEALKFAIIEVKRREVISFCHRHGSCYVCPLNEDMAIRDLCVFVEDDDENELDRVIAEITALGAGGKTDD